MKVRKEPHSIRCLRAIAHYEGGPQAFSEKIGVSYQTYRSWCMQQSVPKQYILKIAQLFGQRVSAEDLLGKYDFKS